MSKNMSYKRIKIGLSTFIKLQSTSCHPKQYLCNYIATLESQKSVQRLTLKAREVLTSTLRYSSSKGSSSTEGYEKMRKEKSKYEFKANNSTLRKKSEFMQK